ncbi:MAG: TIGR01212 family radical SAM protein [Spirochaetales bacterium]|nr:TIGR01212 family radical SAM protein [Spirochaetales bacterium]
MMERYNTYGRYLQERYGHPVYRIGVDAHFTCPNRIGGLGGCVFCDEAASKAVYQEGVGEDARDLEGRIRSVSKQIARGKEFIKRRYGSEHFSLYYQSHTNTYDSIENLKKIYQSGLDEGPFVELIVSTRPDCITEEIVELLASFKDRVEAVVVELGLESSDEGSLVRLGRNHDVASYRRSVGLLRSAGIGVYTHIMLGLPKEDSSTVVKTAHLLNEMGTDGVKIHDLHVLRSTVLEDWHESGEVTVASSDRHLASLVTFLRHLEPRIVVARLICETPRSRRIAPRFPIPKQQIIARLSALLEEGGYVQGDLL